MYVNGIETAVIVDDFFPSIYNKPAFAHSKNNEIWSLILEKAWAKLHGSYMRTKSGQPSFAAQHLLGTPTIRVDHVEKDFNLDKFWSLLVQYDKQNAIMNSTSNFEGTDSNFVDGVAQGHVYSLISVHVV